MRGRVGLQSRGESQWLLDHCPSGRSTLAMLTDAFAQLRIVASAGRGYVHQLETAVLRALLRQATLAGTNPTENEFLHLLLGPFRLNTPATPEQLTAHAKSILRIDGDRGFRSGW